VEERVCLLLSSGNMPLGTIMRSGNICDNGQNNAVISHLFTMKLDLHPPTDALLDKLPGGCHDHSQYFKLPPGQEHYHLLAHLASQLHDSLIVDIGTFLGYSALALSGGSNKVLSLDIIDLKPDGLQLPDSVECKIGNMLEDDTLFPLTATLAVLDVNPHDGLKERTVVEQLIGRKWNGTLVCDDIHLNDGMRSFWDWAKQLPEVDALDVTNVGHCTGTGIIDFRSQHFHTDCFHTD